MPQSTRCPLCLPASRHTSVSFTSFGSLSMPMYHICCHLHPKKKKKGNQRDLKAQRGKTKEGLNVTSPAGWWHFTSTVSLCEFRFCSQICYYSDNESNLITDEEQRLFCWHVGFQSYFKGLTQEKNGTYLGITATSGGETPFSLLKITSHTQNSSSRCCSSVQQMQMQQEMQSV